MTQSIPAGGVSIVPAEGAAAFRLSAGAGDARLDRVDLQGQGAPPAKAIRIQTLRRPAHHWDIQAQTTNVVAVRKGDVLLATFRARCVEPRGGRARTSFVFELGRDPYPKSVDFLLSVGPDWRQVSVPFRAERDYGIGEANISFPLGFQVQTIEIGALSLLDFGQDAELRDMPGFGYGGHEPDAPWRKTAAERIEKIRKADLTVRIVDAHGKPVVGAEVHVRMTRHAFPFGSAIAIDGVRDRTPNGPRYREFIESHFNRIVFENDLKWHTWRADNAVARKNLAETLDWLDRCGIQARGHCLLWPNWTYLPKDLARLKDDPAALRKRVADHVTEEVSALRGRLVEWDVINEPYTNHVLMDILGDEAMVEWFRLARAADPKVKLFINDYAILSAGGQDQAHQDHYEKTIQYLIDRKAPLDGIGMQGHFGSQLTPPERLLAILDRFAAFGKDIEVTEFDVNVPDERLQAEYTRDFYTAAFSHPAVTGVLMWGFWEGRHWRPQAAMVRRDWTLKPNGQAWTDLVMREWWTDVTRTSGPDGSCTARGFLGDYQVTVAAGGRQQSATARLPSGGATLTVELQ